MRVRLPIVAVAVVLAAAGLTGCRTNVGTAATVDSTRISESTVSSYIRPSGVDPATEAAAQNAGQQLLPAKVIVVNFLVQRQVFRTILAANGGVPSEAQLTAALPAGEAASLRPQLTGAGVDASFLNVVTDALELKQELVDRLKITTAAQASAAATKAGVTVRVNARYGRWDPTQLVVSSDGTAPSYLTLPSQSAAPGATG